MDMHLYMYEFECIGSVVFPVPLEVCVEYQLFALWWGDLYPQVMPDYITIYLTDPTGGVWGYILSYPAM